jgi:ribosomal protein L21E
MTIKKISAYEVAGVVYKSAKEAAKAETALKKQKEKERLEKAKADLLAKVDEINVKLGCNTFKNAELNHSAPKFKIGDRVKVISECRKYKDSTYCDCVGAVGIVDNFDSTGRNGNYRVTFLKPVDIKTDWGSSNGSRINAWYDAENLILESTPKFKVGDKVRFLGPVSGTVGKGDGGEITAMFEEFGAANVRVPLVGICRVQFNNMEIVKDSPKFKVGDKVTVRINGEASTRTEKGQIKTVIDHDLYVVSDLNGKVIGHFLDQYISKKSKKVIGKR